MDDVRMEKNRTGEDHYGNFLLKIMDIRAILAHFWQFPISLKAFPGVGREPLTTVDSAISEGVPNGGPLK